MTGYATPNYYNSGVASISVCDSYSGGNSLRNNTRGSRSILPTVRSNVPVALLILRLRRYGGMFMEGQGHDEAGAMVVKGRAHRGVAFSRFVSCHENDKCNFWEVIILNYFRISQDSHEVALPCTDLDQPSEDMQLESLKSGVHKLLSLRTTFQASGASDENNHVSSYQSVIQNMESNTLIQCKWYRRMQQEVMLF